jgi:hypothetical protein
MARRAFDAYLYYWLVLALGQNLISGLWFKLVHESAPPLVTEAKTLSAVVAVLVCFPAIWRYISRSRTLLWSLAAYGAAILINLRSSEPSVWAYGRNFGLPILILLLALSRTEHWSTDRRHQTLIRCLLFITGTLTAGSLAEGLVGTPAWREFMGADTLASLSSLSTSTPLFGVELGRLGGVLGEPVTTGYITASALLAVAMLWLAAPARSGSVRNQPIYFLLTVLAGGTACVLSGVKMAPLLLIVGFAAYLAAKRPAIRPAVVALAPVTVAGVTLTYMAMLYGGLVAQAFTNPIALIRGDSSSIHWAGLVYGIRGIFAAPLGHHLGEGGNFGRLFGGQGGPKDVGAIVETGSESGLGVLAYQLGLPGLVFFVLVAALLARRLGRWSTALIAAWVGAAAVAESMLGPLVAGPLLIAAGLLASDGQASTGPRRSVKTKLISRRGSRQ